jgi:hypothetical protein
VSRSAGARPLTPGERDWMRVRSYLARHRHELTIDAAGGYPPGRTMAGTPLLAAPGGQPSAPVRLADIGLELSTAVAGGPGGYLDLAAVRLPERADGTRYRRYSEAMAELAAPLVFENRVTYRLTEADLASERPRLAFTVGRYFDGIDIGEAAAHEYAAARLGGRPPRPGGPGGPAGLRGQVGDPCDLRRRPANLAISTLTLRLDRNTGRASFLMHWRDPAKVGHAGGLSQVIPVGVFQPSGEAAWDTGHDFSLWRCMIREFAEELRGRSEDYAHHGGPLDYGSWPFARQMTDALDRGQVRVWCLGLGVDPLTFATDLLTVAVIDSDTFDGLFGGGPRPNREGALLAAREFAAHVIDRTVTREPVQAAGAALLRLAWRHRGVLVGLPAAPAGSGTAGLKWRMAPIWTHHACSGARRAGMAASTKLVLRPRRGGGERW